MSRLIEGLLSFYGRFLQHPGKWWVHGRLRSVMNVRIDQDAVVRRDGLVWMLNPGNFMEENLFWLGTNDTWKLYHVKRFVNLGDVIFDVGANFGYYSCKLAQHLRQQGELHAFEPCQANAERLAENVRLNGYDECIRIVPQGITDKVGFGVMVTVAGNSGANYLVAGDGVTRLTTLDCYCAEQGVQHVAFIKLDVEGHEVKALRGAVQTLSRWKPVLLVEVNPPTLSRAGATVQELLELLGGYGYALFEAKRKRLVPLGNIPAGGDYVDVFCIHGSKIETWRKRYSRWIEAGAHVRA